MSEFGDTTLPDASFTTSIGAGLNPAGLSLSVIVGGGTVMLVGVIVGAPFEVMVSVVSVGVGGCFISGVTVTDTVAGVIEFVLPSYA